jgi:hypothetical protein
MKMNDGKHVNIIVNKSSQSSAQKSDHLAKKQDVVMKSAPHLKEQEEEKVP